MISIPKAAVLGQW